MSSNVVHVVGTGTIGEPLVGLLALHKSELGIDEVTFHKRTPRLSDRPMLEQLTRRGALVVTDAKTRPDFEQKLGVEVAYETEEALARATVVIDCTPSGVGNGNKRDVYRRYTDRVRGFIAQGSEFGFGKMYAYGINDEAIDTTTDQFLQVVSCNTHNLSALVKTLGDRGGGRLALEEGRFVLLRRANDISQDSGYVPAPKLEPHDEPPFGTHHARDAHHLFKTLGYDLRLFSSTAILNTQYMHALHFAIRTGFAMTRDEVVARFRENPRIAITEKRTANTVFSFGREHGHYGRILSQTVVCLPTVTVRDNKEVVGFCFTPQDGNSLLSSIAATLRFLEPKSVASRLATLRPYLFQEV